MVQLANAQTIRVGNQSSLVHGTMGCRDVGTLVCWDFS